MYEIKFNHESQEHVIAAIRTYGFKLYSENILTNDDNNSSIKGLFDRSINVSRHSNTGPQIKDVSIKKLNKKFYLSLPCGIFNIIFENIDIEIEIKNTGNPMTSEGIIFIHKEIMIRTHKSLGILLDFVREALNNYKLNILQQKVVDKTVSCWLYDDGYWEKLNTYSQRDMSTIYLEKCKKTKLLNDIKQFRKKETKKRYAELGLRYKRNYLFAGYPGTGKSSLGVALASSLNMGIAIINFGPKVSDAILAKALKDLPKDTILLLEDIDALFKEDRKAEEFKNMITFSGLLNCLDGICFREGLITIMTTNYKNKLDSALNRPGRIDLIMDFEYSTKTEIKMMFDKFFPKLENKFEKFYKKITHTNLTMATVQEYFLERMSGEKLIEDIDILKTRAAELKYDDRPKNGLYI